jgi:hypothetical protein
MASLYGTLFQTMESSASEQNNLDRENPGAGYNSILQMLHVLLGGKTLLTDKGLELADKLSRPRLAT